jgi:DNA repair and recombination protein RAD54 and RAD54-like protein
MPPSALAHRPRHTFENSQSISSTLTKPFLPPIAKHASVLPARKKRKLTSYVEDSIESINDDTFSVNPKSRVALGGLDVNALKARRRETNEIFRKQFSVPAKENAGIEQRIGCAPSLGMLRPTNFVPRPLHDPAGEFAIVLYDPTIDDEPPPKIPESTPAFYMF